MSAGTPRNFKKKKKKHTHIGISNISGVPAIRAGGQCTAHTQLDQPETRANKLKAQGFSNI